MQIDQIRKPDIVKTEKTSGVEMVTPGVASQKKEKVQPEELRNIQMDSPFYNKKMLSDNTVADQLEKDMQRGMDANALTNQAAVYANTTSSQDLQQMQKEGFDPMSTEVDTIVTVVDRIKLAMAKGGKDISAMGDLSAKEIQEMTGNSAVSTQIQNQLESFDMPVQEDTVKEIEVAVSKAEELVNPISPDSVKYLLSNELEPSIDHVYQANFAAGSVEYQKNTDAYVPTEEVEPAMEDQFAVVIKNAGMEVSESTIKDCQWLVENDIPVTAENLEQFQELKTLDIHPEEDVLADIITEAIMDGKKPGEASLVVENSLLIQAKNVFEKQQQELSNITSSRQLQEARLMMSVQANYALLKKGIAIDTMSIQQVVEELKQLETTLVAAQMPGETQEASLENAKQFETFSRQVEELKEAPVAVLKFAQRIPEMTVGQLTEEGKKIAKTFEEANQRYETLWTAPRKDLGDSIQKAFANVDDILEDLELEPTEANRKAVRILSYNEMELTKENIQSVKLADSQVQRLFSSMKPAVVTQMIKNGHNPLDMKIGQLTELAKDLSENGNESNPEEKFAKYLWKLQQTNDISPEERESFIGVYRLMHQVEAGDGAAIGALLAQGTEVTLRNLMTAVRSQKHSGQEFTIDDNFGEIESFDKNSLSITEQIEMAFQLNCVHESGEEITPVKMKEFGGEENYMDLTPEKFRDELLAMDTQEVQQQEQAQEAAYAKEVQENVARALKSEQQVYDMLERYDIPTTPGFLTGIMEMLKDRNSVYRNLLKYSGAEDEDISIKRLMEDLIEDYGEAVKTPEEMANAQRRLEETAENVMKKMLVEKDVSSVDVRGMKLVHTQIQAMGKIAEKEETFFVPIMVEDKVGNLSLKIVRGKEEKGLVDIALNMEDTGSVSASFRYEKGEITGDVSFERKEVQTIFSEHMHLLAEAMQEETGLPVSFKFGWNSSVTEGDFMQEKEPGFEVTRERDEVSTKVLYGVAKSFMDTLTEII